MPMDAITRQKVASEALTWIGTPYHSHGEIKQVGVDCAHLLIGVYSACGVIDRFDPGQYAPGWHLHRSEELFIGWVARYAIPVDQPQIGDIGMWKFGRCYSHGSILVTPTAVVHAWMRSGGVIITGLDEEPLASRQPQWWGLR